METRYNQPIQSSGIVQNNQMICINLLFAPPGNFLLFDLNWKGLEIYGSKSAELHCSLITHQMDQNRKKKEIGANYKGYWI